MVPVRRVVGVGAGVLALLVGCDAAPRPDGGAPTTGGAPVTGTALGTLGAEPTDTSRPTRTADGGAVITVGGARLDGRTDTTPWPLEFELFEDEPKEVGCKTFSVTADSAVPVTVDVSVSNPRLFTLLPEGRNCGASEGDCHGFTFRPVRGTSEQRCRVAVEASRPTGGRASAEVVFGFRGRCTSAAGRPCDDPRVAAASPSPERPVVVTWAPQVATLTAVALPCRQADGVPDPDGRLVCPTTRSPAASTGAGTTRTGSPPPGTGRTGTTPPGRTTPSTTP
ncbi:hypothetical protein [Saccharothrix australiensis]|uniref:Uncharacterized protein n=1 Tax=Saccharothrix australiensis TaxID=2072 RepID=A0A495W6C2_9PSEU|nr:hypothetical protein [Saccharothrix australiensis]RKT55348.1 hypothetical protein C8E97_4011 [Saccharothrix australiensis]